MGEEGEFMKYLEEPMMFSLKHGLVKNMIVSMDEPKCVTKIKKLLLSELQNVNSTFGLKFYEKQPILAVLRTALKAKKVDVMWKMSTKNRSTFLTFCRKNEIGISFSSIYHF